MVIHIVEAGETVYSIAQEYGVPVSQIVANNGLQEPFSLALGEALAILFPEQVHTVAPGETLSYLSRVYNVSLLQLLRNNPSIAENPTLFYPEQTVVIRYPAPAMGKLVVNGYTYPSIRQSLLRQIAPFLTYLTIFSYGITPAGRLINLNDQAVLSTIQPYGVSPLLLLTAMDQNGQFSNLLASQVFNNPTARQMLVQEISRMIELKGYRGVDLDFEYVLPQDTETYVHFVRELSTALNPMGYVVFVALAPKSSSDQQGTLYEGHDYAGMGWAANAALVMTYEWGYAYGPPMAVAPIQSVRRVLDYAVTQIDSNKLLLGIPNYGYDWPLPYVKGSTKARSISNVEAVQLAVRTGATIQYDETAQSPWFSYMDAQGQAHEVWFEDARSIRAKLLLPKEYGLKGVGYWNLMREFPQNWSVLNSMYDVGPDIDL